MGTFKAYFRKEMLESWRQYRYLVLGIGFVLFAILDPLMLKLMPYLLKGQVSPELANALLIQYTPTQAVQNYLGDLLQIVPLFVLLGMMGVFADEIREQRLVFPYSQGVSIRGMVLAKYVHYGLYLSCAIIAGFILNLVYANLLFTGEKIAVGSMLAAALLYSLFYLFLTALLFFASSLTRRGIAAALTVLILTYLSGALSGLQAVADWVPYTLSVRANALGGMDIRLTLPSVFSTCGYIVLLLWLTVRRMKRVEAV